jgi:hypothetical protein
MPPINAQVTFIDGGQFSVSPNPIPVPSGSSPSTITWTFSSRSSAGVQFTNQGIKFKTPPPSGRKQWNQSNQPSGNGSQWTLNDLNNSASTGGLYAYDVNVSFNGRTFTLDPDIENQVPPGDEGDEEDGPKKPGPHSAQ